MKLIDSHQGFLPLVWGFRRPTIRHTSWLWKAKRGASTRSSPWMHLCWPERVRCWSLSSICCRSRLLTSWPCSIVNLKWQVQGCQCRKHSPRCSKISRAQNHDNRGHKSDPHARQPSLVQVVDAVKYYCWHERPDLNLRQSAYFLVLAHSEKYLLPKKTRYDCNRNIKSE